MNGGERTNMLSCKSESVERSVLPALSCSPAQSPNQCFEANVLRPSHGSPGSVVCLARPIGCINTAAENRSGAARRRLTMNDGPMHDPTSRHLRSPAVASSTASWSSRNVAQLVGSGR
eukprot:scaffold117077_cov69-Phaeocystis_antarctica.AAC.3